MANLQSKKLVLSDRFLIGEELGRGAYGQVYKGQDTTTGQTVAIKQISLSGASQENLQSVMGELELLKTLNHKNIVKYIGSFKTRTHLYIILEYMEYGALSSIIKPNRFGVFQEPLVAVYITQVLQGLAYLHAQGVVHRDIKGANILTTKEGLVKLADFGVAAKLGELEERSDELRQNVVGTPYWMAPEVIEMTQVTPASDLWSVGCLVIELLTGYPPYYDLQPMSALFRIVQDTHPPLPEGISPLLEDLLLKCFQKDPALRPSAETLLQHEWVQHHRRTLRSSWNKAQGLRHRGVTTTPAHDNVSIVVNRMLQAESSGEEEAFVPAVPGSTGAALGPTATSRTAAAAAAGVDTGLYTVDATASALQTDTPAYEAFARDGGMGSSAARAAGDVQQQQQQQRLVLPPPPSPRQPGELPRASSGAGAPTTSSSSAAGLPGSSSIELSSTSRHARSSSGAAGGSEAGRSSYAGQQQQQLGRAPLQEGDGAGLNTHPQQQQQQDGSGPSGQAPELNQAGGQSAPVAPPPLSRLGPFAADAGDSPLSTFLSRLQGDEGVCDTPSAAAASSSGHYLTAWLEEGPQGGSVRAGNSGKGWRDFGRATPLGGYLSTEPSVSSDSGVSLNGLDGSDNSFIMESRRKVRDLVRSLRPGVKDANMTPAQACASLALMFGRQADSKQYFLSEGGVLAALELLDSDQPKCAEAALDLVLAFTNNDTRLLEGLCLVGLVPLVCRLTWAGLGHAGGVGGSSSSVGGAAGGPGHERLRLKAAQLVQQLCCARETTLQMLIACGGLGHLVAMVQDNVQDPSTLTFIALSCIWRVLEAFGSLPINYICRILAHAGLVSRLLAVIKQLNTQARYAASRHTHSASSPLAMDAGWDPSSDWGPGPGAAAAGAAGGGGLGSQALSSSMSERIGAAAGAGGRQSPGLEPSYSGSAAAAAGGVRTGESAHFLSRPMDSLGQNGVGTSGSRLRPADPPLPGLPHSSSNSRGEWLMDKCVSLLLVLAHADSVVKANMCSKENVQSLLDSTQRLAMPHLLKVMKALRWLSGDYTVVPALKDAGGIAQLVPFLLKEREGPAGQQELQLEALHVLYNICKFNRHVHLEVAATAGIVPHLCRLAADVASQGAQGGALAAAATPLAAAILAGDPLGNPMQLNPEQALAARRAAVRLHVVPMLIGLACTSSSTRAKLWASSGLDIFLMLLAESDGPLQVGILRAVCLWLSEDFGRVENKLILRDTVGGLVALYGRACRARDTSLLAQLLDLLKTMLSRSSKLAVAMATGGLVPPLLELLGAPPAAVSPLLRAKLLEVIRVLYEHYPRPKEFIIKYKIQEVLRRLLELQGRGDDAVKLEAQKLLNAFHINVLL